MWTDILHVIRWPHVFAAARRTPVSLVRGRPGHVVVLGLCALGCATPRAHTRARPRRSSRRRVSRHSGRADDGAPRARPTMELPTMEPPTMEPPSWNGRSTMPASVLAPMGAPGRCGGTCGRLIASWGRRTPVQATSSCSTRAGWLQRPMRRPGRNRRERGRRRPPHLRRDAGRPGAPELRRSGPTASRRDDRGQILNSFLRTETDRRPPRGALLRGPDALRGGARAMSGASVGGYANPVGAPGGDDELHIENQQ